MLKTCDLCQEEFEAPRKNARFCAKQHYKVCKTCGETFPVDLKYPKNEYCSRNCSNKARSVKRLCKVCGNELPAGKRAKTCSIACEVKLRGDTIAATTTIHCELCGEPFNPRAAGAKFCERQHYKTCEVCGESFPVEADSDKRGRKTCSSSCQGVLVNSAEANEKRKETSLARYGVEYPFQAPEVKEKILQKNMELYGVKTPLARGAKRDEWIEEQKAIHGSIHYTHTPEAQAKRAATNIERYGVDNLFKDKDLQKKLQADLASRIASGEVKHFRVSKLNLAFKELIEDTLSVAVEVEAPLGDSMFADLGLAGTNILIDFNPTVSHNNHIAFSCVVKGCEQPCVLHKAPTASYHQARAKTALQEGKRLLQFYDWDSQASVMKMLRAKLSPATLKISARKLILVRPSKKESNDFLNLYHGQGALRDKAFAYGLSLGGELLAVATFGEARFGAKAQYEFLRYAVKEGVVIHGGAARLFQAFLEEAQPASVISYVDFNHTTAPKTFLHSLGFEEVKPTGPTTYWHRGKTGEVFHDRTLAKLGADKLLGTSYGPRDSCGLSNKDIMLLEGFLPVATAGNRVFLWRASKPL